MNVLVSGLGNPGSFYANTRHQVGRVIVEMLAQSRGCTFKWRTFGQEAIDPAGTGEDGVLKKRHIVYHLPERGMNASGIDLLLLKTAKSKMDEDTTFDRILIVHDDMALPFGEIRLKANSGNHAGHNGIKSIVETGISFTHLKIGIGKGLHALEHALSPFTPQELAVLQSILMEATNVAWRFARDETFGLQTFSMNVLNAEGTQAKDEPTRHQ